ncbi:protein YELLOW LEAF 1, choloroplastic-like [Humulus lupulus]|uniref:protein YELLOW LEAF 1, choloroplastic-like n=1 Tax=Humulus lupulus TaxID=3486 RepID=UPI002B40742D|nr:protein YELLOW LEAF 1, choloroplastic-like [Humulus lupulus]
MSMITATASSVISPPLLPPVGFKRRSKLVESDLGRVCYRFQPLATKCLQVKSDKLGPVQPGTKLMFTKTSKSAMLSTRRQSSSVICAAAYSARCSAEQTQTVTRQAPTMTHMPTKEKLPDLDDGGTGFPPRDDGDGGGGGGGGGGNWSGGFFFFGFLLFLGFLKDKESEGPYQEDRRR